MLDGPAFLATLLEWVLRAYSGAFERLEEHLEEFDVQTMRGESKPERDIERLVAMRREVGILRRAAARSKRVGDEEMADDIRWIRSYVLEEGGGSVGTVCIYEASSPEAIRKHASVADLPVDEIIPIADTVVLRPDPVHAPT